MNCRHEKTISRWVGTEYWGDDGSSCHSGDWEHDTVSTIIDLDTHRYQCTQCNEIMYYSGRAQEYHEQGRKFDGIKGLDK